MSEEHQQQSEPPNQNPTLEILQETIRRLEGIVAQLDEESVDLIASTNSLPTLVSAVEDLEEAMKKAKQEKTKPIADKTEIKTDTTIQTEEEKVDEIAVEEQEDIAPEAKDSRKETFFGHTLGKISSLFSKKALIAIIIVIGVGVLFASGLLFRDSTPEVAEIPEVKMETPPKVEIPLKPEPIKNEPKPKLELNPEQSLIAAIQEQVAEITNEYADGLIVSLEANFINSSLIVKASDTWYQLTPDSQEKVANEILSRGRKLDFKKLNITDSKGKLLARNPVVGKNMIILP
ncbi:MAG: hypothetical protein GDA44_15180 [Prochloron sp. SP5CPC1]|nr:hypothetical protein [Candidatus Paraprochloron terpiosi SP5CPC1]